MEREQYFNLITTLSNLSREMVVDTIDDRRNFPGEDMLLVVFDIFPRAKSFFNIPDYHKTNDREQYKETVRINLKHFLVSRYKKWFSGEYEEAGNVILKSLFEPNSPEALLNLSDTLATRYKEPTSKTDDVKIIFADIFNHWLTYLIHNEVPEEYQGPKTIEVPAQEKRSVVATAKSSHQETAYSWEAGIDDGDDYRDESIEFDDDGSNWAYNERHDD